MIFLKIQLKYIVFMSLWSRTMKILFSNWPRTRIENSASFLILQAWETFSYHGYALRLIFMHWLVKIWQVSSCLCSILKLVSTSFVSTCDVFNCLFPLDVQYDSQLLSRVFCYSWLVCFLGFWLRNASLVKVGNPISGGIVFVFHLAWCVILRF